MSMFTKLGRLAAEVTGRLAGHLLPEPDTKPTPPVAAMPHCDSAVLHAPGVCEYCDQYPSWQRAREMARIGFTGDAPRPGWLPCPSTFHRPLTVINQWPGNQPSPRLVPRPDQQLPPGDDQP